MKNSTRTLAFAAKATHNADERARGVWKQVLAVDDRVVGVDDKVAERPRCVRIILLKPEKCLITIAQAERKQRKL